MKDDEKNLLLLIYKNKYSIPRFIINDKSKIEINHKRALYILEKNCDKGYYEFGISLDTGWLTPKGIEFIETQLLGGK